MGKGRGENALFLFKRRESGAGGGVSAGGKEGERGGEKETAWRKERAREKRTGKGRERPFSFLRVYFLRAGGRRRAGNPKGEEESEKEERGRGRRKKARQRRFLFSRRSQEAKRTPFSVKGVIDCITEVVRG